MNISHFFFGSALLGMITVPVIATSQHWGIPSEKNPNIVSQFNDCPDIQKNSLGFCPSSHRSSSRNYSGGSFSSGK